MSGAGVGATSEWIHFFRLRTAPSFRLHFIFSGSVLYTSSGLDESVSLLTLRMGTSMRAQMSRDSRMQTIHSAKGGPVHPSTFSILRMTVTETGFRSLYTGLSASIMRQMTYSLVRLGAYEKMKAHLSKDGPAPASHLFLAAMIAGGLGGMAGNPAGRFGRAM